jgi:hypothetical protein
MAKKNYICVNDMIWADDDIINLQSETAFRFILLIAWSKSNRKDGWFSDLALYHVRGNENNVKELIAAGLVTETQTPAAGYSIRSFEEWQTTSTTMEAMSKSASAAGRISASKRAKPVPAGSFDAEKAGAECFAMWPEESESRFREKRTVAIDAFVQNITADDYEAFKSALAHRLAKYSNEPGHDRRWGLGAFKNFCVKWQDWIPKDYGLEAAAVPEREPVIWRPSMDDL